uniref:Uncharacterized protein n=1 Tax=Morchella importuna TaxID=1174673 RepID=A0A650AG91_9PEZI|nr:hypothetical protein [Morchella importuna]QGN66709.1 hypothetical protein [Morchella importuna]
MWPISEIGAYFPTQLLPPRGRPAGRPAGSKECRGAGRGVSLGTSPPPRRERSCVVPFLFYLKKIIKRTKMGSWRQGGSLRPSFSSSSSLKWYLFSLPPPGRGRYMWQNKNKSVFCPHTFIFSQQSSTNLFYQPIWRRFRALFRSLIIRSRGKMRKITLYRVA